MRVRKTETFSFTLDEVKNLVKDSLLQKGLIKPGDDVEMRESGMEYACRLMIIRSYQGEINL